MVWIRERMNCLPPLLIQKPARCEVTGSKGLNSYAVQLTAAATCGYWKVRERKIHYVNKHRYNVAELRNS